MSPIVIFTRYVFMLMFTLTNSSANMAGFHSEYHKNAVVLVDRITELLQFNDAVFFVQCPGHCSNFPAQSRRGKLQCFRPYLGWLDSTMLIHAGNITDPCYFEDFSQCVNTEVWNIFCFGWFWKGGHAKNWFQNNHSHHLCTRKHIQGTDSNPWTDSRKKLRKPLRSATLAGK